MCAIVVEVSRRIAEICGDCHVPTVKQANNIVEACGDDESAKQLHGQNINILARAIP